MIRDVAWPIDVSVVLCTRNRPHDVLRFVRSLSQQTELPLELILVDSGDMPLNASGKWQEVLTEIGGRYRLRYLHTEPGLTRQRNIGVKHADGEVIYFFDDDIVLSRDFIKLMNDTFRRNPGYAGGMGNTSVSDSPDHWWASLERFYNRVFLLTSGAGDGKFQKSGLPRYAVWTKDFRDVEILSGGLTGYRKVLFDEFSFDESLPGYSYMEDVDFSRRVSRQYRLFYNPDACVEHLESQADRMSVRHNRKMFIFNYRYLFWKNYRPKSRMYLVPHLWAIFGLFLRSLILRRWQEVRGYLEGLREFERRRGDILSRMGQGKADPSR